MLAQTCCCIRMAASTSVTCVVRTRRCHQLARGSELVGHFANPPSPVLVSACTTLRVVPAGPEMQPHWVTLRASIPPQVPGFNPRSDQPLTCPTHHWRKSPARDEPTAGAPPRRMVQGDFADRGERRVAFAGEAIEQIHRFAGLPPLELRRATVRLVFRPSMVHAIWSTGCCSAWSSSQRMNCWRVWSAGTSR